jgi:carbon monoxide dehydrogenase subunit G
VTTFSASKHAVAVVEADQKEIWAVLVDPDLMARLTKYVKRITEDGEHWRWELSGLEVLGRAVAPSFTERMVFDEPDRIEFHHEPPGRREPAGVNGWYQLTALPDGATRLETDMSICVDLPLPRVSGRAVERVMAKVLDSMGDGFSANLLAHLGATERPS